MTIDWTDSESYEFIESTANDGTPSPSTPFHSDSFVMTESETIVTSTDYPSVCLPLSVFVYPIVYTVAMCVEVASGQAQVATKTGFDWPIYELWWPAGDTPSAVDAAGVTMRVPQTEFQLVAGAGNPGRPGGYTFPLDIYDTAAGATATVLLDIAKADGEFYQQIEMEVTSVSEAKVILPDGVTMDPGDYTARFIVAWSYQTISVPTVPITIHVRSAADG